MVVLNVKFSDIVDGFRMSTESVSDNGILCHQDTGSGASSDRNGLMENRNGKLSSGTDYDCVERDLYLLLPLDTTAHTNTEHTI